MKIIPLHYSLRKYSCSAYLIISSKLEGHNTLVDVGCDGFVIDEILTLVPPGINPAVNQVVLTHYHSDHAGGVPEVKARFNPQVYAFQSHPLVDCLLGDGDKLFLGEQEFVVLHTPGHSDDSICLYCPATGALFAGDTSLNIISPSISYPKQFLTSLERISQLDVKAIYPGHGRPILTECNKKIRQTLEFVRESLLY